MRKKITITTTYIKCTLQNTLTAKITDYKEL